MHNNSVEPSPEHLAMIQENMARQASASQLQAMTKQAIASQQQVERDPEGLAETTARQESTRAPGLSWFTRLLNGLQASSGTGRGDPSSGGEAAASDTEAGQERQEDTQEDLGYDSLEYSDLGTPSDISELSLAETHTTEEAKRVADKKRAEAIAMAREVISRLAKVEIDSDPVLNYRFDVPNADPEAMAMLWHASGAAKRYPTSGGFPCSGRPWEVKVHRSSVAEFFGPEFCHRDAIIRSIDNFSGPAEIYAHFEGDFLHIGFTIPKDVVFTDLSEATKVPLTLFSTMKKFNTLARWARNVESGLQQSFVDYIDYIVRQDLINMGMRFDRIPERGHTEDTAASSTSAAKEKVIW
jgi:hypothetical protein